MHQRYVLPFLTFAFAASLAAQTQPVTPLLKVFLDRYTFVANREFIITETPFVDYVSDQRLADVQVQLTPEPVGNGAVRYVFYFFGSQQFTGQNDTIVWHQDPLENEGSVREKALRAYKQGLLRYLLQTPWAGAVDYQMTGAPDHALTRDSFNYWTFSVAVLAGVNGGSSKAQQGGGALQQSSDHSVKGRHSLSAWRITERTRFGNSVNYEFSQTKEKDVSDTIAERSGYQYFQHYTEYGTAIGTHWAVGGILNGSYYERIPFDEYNQRYNLSISGGVEYNFYPYREYFRRRLLAHYFCTVSADLGRRRPPDVLIRHRLQAQYATIARWGYINLLGNIDYHQAHSRNDTDLELTCDVGINLTKNLYLNLLTMLNRTGYHDSDPLNPATRQSFAYQSALGLSYYFGSGYRNVVNPRLRPLY